MRHLRTVALVLALLVAACGGGDDADNNGAGNNETSTTTSASNNSGDPNELTANFNLDDLPGDFPRELVPPSWTAGQATDILGPFAVNFESDMSFAEALAFYEGVLGEANVVVGDPGEQLAQWTDDPIWVTSIFEDDPLLIGFVSLAE